MMAGETDDPRDELERARDAFSEGRSAYEPSEAVDRLGRALEFVDGRLVDAATADGVLRRWRVYLEGIAVGALEVEAETEAGAIEAAAEDGDLHLLVTAYDVHAVSAVELEADAGGTGEVA